VSMRTRLRWVLVVPAAIAAWYAVFIIGLFTHDLVENTLCPSDQLESGTCTNETVIAQLHVVVHVFVALSAVAVILAAVFVAPSHKKVVAWIALLCGATVASLFAVAAEAWSEGLVALMAGITVTALLGWKRKRDSA